MPNILAEPLWETPAGYFLSSPSPLPLQSMLNPNSLIARNVCVCDSALTREGVGGHTLAVFFFFFFYATFLLLRLALLLVTKIRRLWPCLFAWDLPFNEPIRWLKLWESE